MQNILPEVSDQYFKNKIYCELPQPNYENQLADLQISFRILIISGLRAWLIMIWGPLPPLTIKSLTPSLPARREIHGG